jgi:hypothetical protein
MMIINWIMIAFDNYSPGQVRKEKLGDRITALQQLVSPFGKVPFSILFPRFGYSLVHHPIL